MKGHGRVHRLVTRPAARRGFPRPAGLLVDNSMGARPAARGRGRRGRSASWRSYCSSGDERRWDRAPPVTRLEWARMAGRRAAARARRPGSSARPWRASPAGPRAVGNQDILTGTTERGGVHGHADRDRRAGAIGCVVGGLLTKAGRDVTLIDQWPEHIEAMKTRGLRLSGTCGDHTIPVRALHLHEVQSLHEPFDLAFVAVKSYDTEWRPSSASPTPAAGGVVVDFQNGINDERVAAVAGRERTLGASSRSAPVSTSPATRRAPTRPRRLQGRRARRRRLGQGADLARILNEVAPSTVTTNLWGERWSKLAVNCMANPLAGLSGLGSAEVRSEAAPRRIAIHLAAEVIRVGRALGHQIEPLFGIEAQRFVDARRAAVSRRSRPTWRPRPSAGAGGAPHSCRTC